MNSAAAQGHDEGKDVAETARSATANMLQTGKYICSVIRKRGDYAEATYFHMAFAKKKTLS